MIHENQAFVEECADLAKHFSTLYKESPGFISVDSRTEGPTVYLTVDCFLACFGDSFKVLRRNDMEFPWRLVHVENDVQFFCITARNPKE